MCPYHLGSLDHHTVQSLSRLLTDETSARESSRPSHTHWITKSTIPKIRLAKRALKRLVKVRTERVEQTSFRSQGKASVVRRWYYSKRFPKTSLSQFGVKCIRSRVSRSRRYSCYRIDFHTTGCKCKPSRGATDLLPIAQSSKSKG